jgi:hypothetical protein
MLVLAGCSIDMPSADFAMCMAPADGAVGCALMIDFVG